MSRMEEYNYQMDPRTIAASLPKQKIEERSDGNFLIWEEWTDDTIIRHELRCKWEVCDQCDGNGKHTNPSIDASGITDWDDWDYDEREGYFRGDYDVTCTQCNGRRVMPVLDEHNNDAELVKRYHQYQTDLYNDARTSAQERAMGA